MQDHFRCTVGGRARLGMTQEQWQFGALNVLAVVHDSFLVGLVGGQIQQAVHV